MQGFCSKRLPRRVASVDEHRASRHEAAGVTQSKEGSTSEFLRVGKATEHVLGFPDSPGGRVLLKDLLNHGRNDVARAKTVDTNAVTAPFHG